MPDQLMALPQRRPDLQWLYIPQQGARYISHWSEHQAPNPAQKPAAAQ